MNDLYKIAAVGDYDSIFGFAAVGFDIYPVNSKEEARGTLSSLASKKYGIIYVTEEYLFTMTDIIAEYQQSRLPAITAIPSISANIGFARDFMKKTVEKAVGTDIGFEG